METLFHWFRRRNDGGVSNYKNKVNKEIEILEDVLAKSIELLEDSISMKREEVNIERIFETIEIEPPTLVDLIQQHDHLKYSLLLGCCYMLGRGISKDEKMAFNRWEGDPTYYGIYLIGTCYGTGYGG